MTPWCRPRRGRGDAAAPTRIVSRRGDGSAATGSHGRLSPGSPRETHPKTQAHLEHAHAAATPEAKAAAVAAADEPSARSATRTGPRRASAGEGVAPPKSPPAKALPRACALARDGDAAALAALVAKGEFSPLDLRSRDAHGQSFGV